MRESVRSSFTVGESLAWQKSFDDYLPSEGWSLKYSFRGAGAGFDVTATVDCDDFLLNVLSSVTENCAAGKYYYQGFVENDGQRILVDSGEIEALPNLSIGDAETVFDGRSQVKKTLDLIDQMIAGKATLDQQSYVIGNRQLVRIPIGELMQMRDKYQDLYNQELRAARRKKGNGGPFKSYPVRFRKAR